MDQLKKAWNFSLSAEANASLKARAIKAFVWFLTLMLCFTLISRALDSLTIPLVQTKTPTRSTIIHQIIADGILKTAKETAVLAPSGAMVTSIEVNAGDMVQAGDLLLVYDTKEIKFKISQEQLELAVLQRELAGINQRTVQKEEENTLSLERAEQDYALTEDRAELAIRNAGEKMRQARQNLQKYDGVRNRDYEDEEYTESEYNALRAAYRESVIDYDKAVAERDAALIHAQRVIDDANTATVNEGGDLKNLQIKLKQLELSRLYEVVASNGEVYAPCDGMITRVEAGIGSYTASEAAIFINGTDSVHFVAQVGLEQKKYVNQGNLATIELVGEKQARENIPITSITPSKEGSGFYTFIVELPSDSLVLGTSGTAQLKQSSGQTYETCVPLSALRNDGANDYVLTVRETQTAMGTEYVASRVDVVLLERNESYAAITGGLTGSSQIITQANKAVSDGDRVRLAERE